MGSRILVLMLLVGCGPRPTSAIGESCSSTGDCIEGKCVDLVCRPDHTCTPTFSCRDDSFGSLCTDGRCGCNGDPDCTRAVDGRGRAQPYCSYRDASTGIGLCTSVRI